MQYVAIDVKIGILYIYDVAKILCLKVTQHAA